MEYLSSLNSIFDKRMTTTSCEHTHQGPCGALATFNTKTTTDVTENREEETVGAEEEHRDASNRGGEEGGHASATRINTIKEKADSTEGITKAIEDSTKQKEEYHERSYIKRMGRLVKDTARSVKDISFDDLDGQKFKLYKIAIQLASEYIELVKAKREETRK